MGQSRVMDLATQDAHQATLSTGRPYCSGRSGVTLAGTGTVAGSLLWLNGGRGRGGVGIQ